MSADGIVPPPLRNFHPSSRPKMSNFKPSSIDELSVATIRCLAADVVAKANSGHPGMPMGSYS